MEGALIPVWITAIVGAAGSIYSITRNGRVQRQKDTELKVELKKEIQTINKRLDDPTDGLKAIKTSTETMKNHCTHVSTEIAAQVKTNKEEIDRLREESLRKRKRS